MLEPFAVVRALGFGHPDRDHLSGIVPLVDRRRDVEAFVALQTDEAARQRRRKHLGYLGLADASLAFEKQRAPHLEGKKQHGRQRPVGKVIRRPQQIESGVDRGGQRARGLFHESRAYSLSLPDLSRKERKRDWACYPTAAATARRASTPTR